MQQTIQKTMKYPYCPSSVNQYNRMDPMRDSGYWKCDAKFQQGALQDPKNMMYNKNDMTNSAQCKQNYGDTSYPYINRDKYPMEFNKILDIEQTENSKYLPYYLPDKTQYPVYQWQNSYSSFRNNRAFDLYNKKSVSALSEIQKTKGKTFNTVY
jgi:hypothetical protein